jgi:hypothetical protein
MGHLSCIFLILRAGISGCIILSVTKEIRAHGTDRIYRSSRYRSEHVQEETPINNLQTVTIPLKIKTSLRGDVEVVESCNSDTCCDSYYFCQNLNFVCAPCSECYYNSNGVGNGCTDRCSLAPSDNLRFPSLRWLSLSTTKVDASRSRQFVDMRFAVQHDASGLLSAQVTLTSFLPLAKTKSADTCLLVPGLPAIAFRCASSHSNRIRAPSRASSPSPRAPAISCHPAARFPSSWPSSTSSRRTR